ncbi:MAG: hypothetical protein IKE60_21320 [Reyranella sp.]|uniref:hypothetical protein n=1 Tax=Reyranella sp. TaxID=1929291 RepID=UPI0025FE527E|nr:hypothetical protein [Reyranella sp.]MBR2817213.1 hypothetical protein [Reyranella sp.]
MTASMRRLLVDPYRMEEGATPSWTMPSVLPETRTIRDAVAELTRTLQPADEQTVQVCLKALAHGTAHKMASTQDWKYQARLYHKVLIDVPADIWTEVTQELLRTCEWFPGTATIAKRCEPRIAERQRMLERAEAMLARATAATPRPTVPARSPSSFVKERVRRMEETREIWRRLGRTQDVQRLDAQIAQAKRTPTPGRRGPTAPDAL